MNRLKHLTSRLSSITFFCILLGALSACSEPAQSIQPTSTGGAATGIESNPSQPPAENPDGQPADAGESGPSVEFELPGLDGKIHRLSDWKGQWVVVNYWATWCAPCRKEIPDFSRMHDARDDITVLGLAFEDTSIEDFRDFLDEYPASYPILLVDVYEPPQALGAPRALPTTYLVDPQGELVETWIGPITSETIENRIDNGG